MFINTKFFSIFNQWTFFFSYIINDWFTFVFKSNGSVINNNLVGF